MGGGVRHSPAEGVGRRGVPEGLPRGCARGWCRCWEPPHALGGLLCGRRGSPERCAIALPRGCAGGDVPAGCRCWEPPHALGAPSWSEGGALEGCTRGVYRMSPVSLQGDVAVGSRRISWKASYVGGGVAFRGPEEGAGSVYGWYGGFQRWCSHASARIPIPYTTETTALVAVL